jgi:thiamine-phosphate pyrophosphorylase
MRDFGRLHVITDTEHQDRWDHLELARLALEGGAGVIQLREKRAATREQIATARALAAHCRGARAVLIVNDRIDVALASDAHGVHLGRDDFPLTLAREMLGPDRILGASARTLEEARAAERAGADYVGLGPAYATASKADAGAVLGPAGLAPIIAGLEIPVVAIGGITAENAAAVLGAGAHGLAVISAVTQSEDPAAATRALCAAIAAARGEA